MNNILGIAMVFFFFIAPSFSGSIISIACLLFSSALCTSNNIVLIRRNLDHPCHYKLLLLALTMLILLLSINYIILDTSVFFFKSVLQLAICLLALLCGLEFKCDMRYSVIFLNIIKFLTIFNLIIYLVAFSRQPLFKSIYGHSNYFGAYMFLLLAFYKFINCIKRDNNNILWEILLIILIVLSDTRSALIAAFIVTIFPYFLKYINLSKLVFFLLLSSFFISMIYFYTYPPEYIDISYLNRLTYSITQKNLLSGRQVLWSQLISQISNSPFLGYGLSKDVSQFYNSPLSAHNWFIQSIIQIGIIGTSLILTPLITSFFLNYKKCMTQFNKLSISFIIAIIFQQNFEVMLTQNHLTLGVLYWIILGLTLNQNFSSIQSNSDSHMR